METLLVVGLVLLLMAVAFAVFVRRPRREQAIPRVSAPAIGSGTMSPRVTQFHVRGDEAQVYFDVPVGAGKVEPVLADLLARAAVEVVREKRHSLPLGEVAKVVAFAKDASGPVRAKEVMLAVPGELPAPAPEVALIPHGGHDFISLHFETEPEASGVVPGWLEGRRSDRVGPAGPEIRLTARLEAGLRASGIDPSAAAAGDLVIGVLRMSGFQVTSQAQAHLATKQGVSTYLLIDEFTAGDYPEISEEDINQFMIGFASSGADRGIFVSDRYRPLLAYEKERREPRVRFVTREGLQRFIDGAAMD